MALTRLQNIISSVEGRILYVNPDDFDATDAIDNKGNSPIRPFKTIARAVLEVARYSYVSAGSADDKFDQFTIMLYPGDHIVDNRPGEYPYELSGANFVPAISAFSDAPIIGEYGWSNVTKQYGELYKIVNSHRGGLIIPRGVSIIGLDLRKTKIRPKYVPAGGSNDAAQELLINFTANPASPNEIEVTTVTGGDAGDVNDLIVGSLFEDGVFDNGGVARIAPGTRITGIDCTLGSGLTVKLSKPHTYTATTSPSGITVAIPYEDDNSRTALFRITGGCYFWQFTMLDGDPNGVYTSGAVKPQVWSSTVSPQISHTKLTIFEYASLHDLHVFYRKVSDAISVIDCTKIEPKIQENRIVGPLADSVSITKVVRNRNVVTVTLAEELNITAGNFVSIIGTGNFITGSTNTNPLYTGEKQVSSVNSRSEFTFVLDSADVSTLNSFESGSDEDALETGVQITYTPNATAKVEIEIDTVESASPYIFNVSLRSTYGTCGMHADGSRATGFKSMVVAQYTGISLQKQDSAFLKYDVGTNTYINDGSSLYHKDIDAVYNPLQRSYHVKASNRAVIQAVSVFAVGFADHFIAEDGGDMSITNSNSNFGSNALRSIGYSDTAFKKDSLGTITHIIPPRNVESELSNVYWESIDTIKTAQHTDRIYIADRTEFVEITSGGSLFTSTSVTIQDPEGANLTLNLTLNNGVATAVQFAAGPTPTYGTFQPGDTVHVPNPDNTSGLPIEFTIGGTLTTLAGGRYDIGQRNLNKDGSSTNDAIYVPLYAIGATSTSEQYANIQPAVNGNIFEYDFTSNNWYVNVNPAANQIYTSVSGNTDKYGAGKIESTPTTYIKRIVDERIDDEKIYRLRYTTKRGADGTLPSFPTPGYVIQPKKGQGIAGVGDRFTDGANLLLLNKYFLAEETVARFLNANPSFNITGGNQRCIDDLIDIIEAISYNLRYGGNNEVYDASSYYVVGGNLPETERGETVTMLNTYLKPMVESVIDNTLVSGTIVNTNATQTTISNEEQLIIVGGGCTNVVTAANTLIDIVINAVGSDNNPGSLPASRTVPTATYTRIRGQEFNDVYYIYEVEEVVPYKFENGIETEGVYYLTVLKGSIPVSSGILPGNNFKFSQNIDNLYPNINIDNVVSDPIIAKSIADAVLIGNVKTTNGLSNAVNDPVDTSYSISKESLAYFFDEYLNNELEWVWTGKETLSSNVSHKVNLNNLDGTHGETIVNLTSTSGDGEVRKVPINPTREVDGIEVELRRPSTIRSGNHTFEYVGFGPGNYSTGFPIRQTKVLSTEQQKYSQSLKEQGGIAFYSGLNSNGDLYIGNTVINAVTGKTTSNEINELNQLTIKDNLNVLGGAGNRITSNFQGPVSFRNDLNGEGNVFLSNIQLRNQDGIISKILNSDTTPPTGGAGDFIFNTQPEEGGFFGWSYTANNEWRPTGLIGTEKIHAYKDGTSYTLNVGSNLVNLSSNTTVNTNYDLDVTTSQRVGEHIDLGVGATAAITSNTASKETRLYIEQAWDTVGVTYKPIEIKLTNDSGTGKMIDMIKADGTSVFSVDKEGNVAIQAGSSYGISNRAFICRLTAASTTNTANNEINTQAFVSNITVDKYTGSSSAGTKGFSYGFRTDTDLGTFEFVDAPADLDNFNTRSILMFINGVLQTPFEDFYFDGSRFYFNQEPINGSKIELRFLAN